MTSRALVVAVIGLCLLGFGAGSARAAKVDTQIGDAFEDGDYLLGLATTSDKSEKLGAIIIRGPDPSKNEDKPRATFFNTVQQWNEFLALWNKARATTPPKRDAVMATSTDIGDYWDDDDQVIFGVSVDSGGSINFILEDSDKWPMLFDVQPADFKRFDDAVNKMTAYFRN